MQDCIAFLCEPLSVLLSHSTYCSTRLILFTPPGILSRIFPGTRKVSVGFSLFWDSLLYFPGNRKSSFWFFSSGLMPSDRWLEHRFLQPPTPRYSRIWTTDMAGEYTFYYFWPQRPTWSPNPGALPWFLFPWSPSG